MNLESVAARGRRAGAETGCYPYENVAPTPMFLTPMSRVSSAACRSIAWFSWCSRLLTQLVQLLMIRLTICHAIPLGSCQRIHAGVQAEGEKHGIGNGEDAGTREELLF